MTANRLATRPIEKVWGKHHLPRAFDAAVRDCDPVGEIWFEDRRGGTAELLVKYLFTSDKLSIQVHPDDQAARAKGHPRGKDEAWLIVAAEPGAKIGLGLHKSVGKEALRAAALDGSIEELVCWRSVKAGDFYYSPAGTIHALGPGLTLIEVQQNLDLTYRLYDYGRARELHLDDALEAARLEPYTPQFEPYQRSPGREILAAGGAFVIERWTVGAGGSLAGVEGRPVWVVPVSGGGIIDGEPLEPARVWVVDDQSRVQIEEGSEVLLAYPGAAVIEELLVSTRVSPARDMIGDRRHYRPAVRIEPSFVAGRG